MNKAKIFFLLIGMTSFFIFNLAFADTQIAIGTFVYHDNIELPMLITNEKNSSWSFIDAISNVENGAYLYHINCRDKTCIATGSFEAERYYWPKNHRRPLFIISKDHGRTWSTIKNISGLPSMTDGIAPYISCVNSNCTAVGFYQSNDGPTFPLLLVSHDSGESWSYMQNISHHPATMKEGSLDAISCTGNICISAGTYLIGPYYDLEWIPYVLISSDGGASWSFVQDIKGLPQMRPATLTAIKCNKNFCVIAGTYDYKHALLLISQDKGQTWKFVNDIPDLANLERLSIEDLIYTNGSFIAVGGYVKDKGFLQSLILISNDNGESWSLVKDISGSESKKLGWLKSISCSNNACVAGGDGFYKGGANFGLTLLVSQDNGKSWSLIPYVAGTTYTPTINVVQCSDNHCIAIGYFTDHIDYSHPALLVSDDKGQSWSVAKNILNFPQNVYDVRFSSTLFDVK